MNGVGCMTPEKFFDYLEGKLPPEEREALEHALIGDPELQKQFVAARRIHRRLEEPAVESSTVIRPAARGPLVAAAFAALVGVNVAIGLYFIFRSGGPSAEAKEAQVDAIRRQVENSVEKAAAATFTPPTIAAQPILLTIPPEKQEAVAKAIIDAAEKAGGSGAKELPRNGENRVLVLVPASAEAQFRQTLTALGAPPAELAAPTPASPDQPVHLEIVLSLPRNAGE
jgi:hypothetical protein